MAKKYSYSLTAKIAFYFSYFWYKLILPLEVKTPKLKLWIYEWAYSLMKFKGYEISIPWKHDIDRIITKFGNFRIRVNTSDAANVSPAFERLDLNFLKRLINRRVLSNKKVLFLDIGGDLGSYSVFVANSFKGKDVTIKCFEPIEESWTLIKENINTNHADEMFELYPFALYDNDNDDAEIRLDIDTPGSSSIKNEESKNVKIKKIKTRRLDGILKDEIKKYDTVVCKIDVEGVEQEVIMGMTGLFDDAKELIVMVEDFVNPEIIKYLEKMNGTLCQKLHLTIAGGN